MERTPAKRSSLFLLDLMIAILFFCLASAVCVQIFVKAHTTSRETQELNTALEKVSGYTELFLADALTEDTEVFYDADWQECSDPGGAGWKAFAWNIYGAAPVRRTAGRNLFGGNRPDDRHGKGVTGRRERKGDHTRGFRSERRTCL